MIEVRKGNMLTNVLPVDVEQRENVLRIMVQGTNCRGRMGSGIAKSIRALYPEAYFVYKHQFDNYGLVLGGITSISMDDEMFMLVNANTQDKYAHYRNEDYSIESPEQVFCDYDAVRKAFATINSVALERLGKTNMWERTVDEVEIHFPLIGCGLANGDWAIVSEIINEELDDRFKKVLWKLED